MAKIVCPHCGKRMITEKILTSHVAKNHSVVQEPTEEGVEAAKEEVLEQVPQYSPTPVETSLTLRFRKPVEITINGVAYSGSEVVVKDMIVASEIVRIAKEAYGWDILI